LILVKVLQVAKPVELPESTKFELVINLKTAKVLGLSMRQGLLVAANEEIE
jgi:putative ABC transport system substrate-binding protein